MIRYAIVTAPRSGSNHLCELLQSTGRLGHPEEYHPKVEMLRPTRNGVRGTKVLTPGWYVQAERRFGITKFVHLVRHDAVAQAVSAYIGIQTGKWMSTSPGNGHPDPAFDFDALRQSYDRILLVRRTAEAFCVGREPLRIVYEDDLLPDPVGTVRRIAAFLGVDLDGVPGGQIRSPLKIQRTAETKRWADELRRLLPTA